MSKTPTPKPTAASPLPTASQPLTTPPNQFQTGDWLTIATILLTISAAIIYFAGWVYEAYWYSFFGINLTQINIPLQQIMIEGLPGIVVIAVSSFIATMIFNIFPIRTKGEKTNTNIIWIVVTAYGICVLFVFMLGIAYRGFLMPLPYEIGFSSLGLVFVFAVLVSLQIFRRKSRTSLLLNATKDVSPLLINIALSSLSLIPGVGIASGLLSKIGEDAISSALESVNKKYPNRVEKIAIDIINAWRVWIGLVVLFFILLSLTISAILGRANAHFGQRLMMGGWEIQETYVYSSKSDLPLPHSPASISEEGYTYGPFGLIANDDQVYYLADWNSDHFQFRPNLYTLPRANDTSLIILYAPQPTATPTPIPTLPSTPTLTAIPSPITLTPTP